jgi:predicted amidohydrolase
VVRAAVVQMRTGDAVGANLAAAERLVRRAAALGARIVVLPERWNLIAAPDLTVAGAESLDGPSLGAAAGWARELGLTLVAGSIAERPGPSGRAPNTSVVIGPDGARRAVYRKVHLFDVDVAGRAYRESDATEPGGEAVTADAAGVRLGLSVCYDLRFPGLYARLARDGATVLTVPAAFTEATGRDHWEVLLRARAIENQAHVLAAGQWGRHADGSVSHGRSMIVDPWGLVLARCPDGEGVAVADLDLDAQAALRASMPVLAHRRPEVYGGG